MLSAIRDYLFPVISKVSTTGRHTQIRQFLATPLMGSKSLHVILLLLDACFTPLAQHGEKPGHVAFSLGEHRWILELFGHRLAAQIKQMTSEAIQFAMQFLGFHFPDFGYFHRLSPRRRIGDIHIP
jgi:hypothetical protein